MTPVDPELANVYADLKLSAGLAVILVFCTFGFLICLGFLIFGGPGTWLDSNVGDPPLGVLGVAVLGGVTLLIGMGHRWLHNRLLHHPRYGKEPRFDR
jgi:multisubunit Na+/H+ antiporter MnhB subunit